MNEVRQTTIDVPEGMKIARRAFIRDFPTLLANRRIRGKFVCYHKDKLVFAMSDYRVIIREAVAQGFPDDEWLVIKVTPEAGREQQDFEDEVEINPN